VESIGIYPTLLDVCGFKVPDYVEGTSMRPLLMKGEKPVPWISAAFSQFPRGKDKEGYAVRGERFRYVEWRSKPEQQVISRELYDHQSDPNESVNLSGHPEYASALASMEQQLHAGWKKALPPGVVNISNNPEAPASEKLHDEDGGDT
jgi:iduronate 2-sulfatase